MDRLAATKIFLRVAETHSFTAVARELGVGQPAVSKTLAALEQKLRVTLVRRTSRSVNLTRAGQALLDEVRPLIAEVEETFARLSRGDRSPAGIVRVAVAPGFGRLYVVPALRTMRAKYPDISVEIAASDRHANLVEENLDVAVRGGELRGVSALCHRVAIRVAPSATSP
jgi:DNA-binding transcriptional LysR family regulator